MGLTILDLVAHVLRIGKRILEEISREGLVVGLKVFLVRRDMVWFFGLKNGQQKHSIFSGYYEVLEISFFRGNPPVP
jgi:hypothetical protein